MEYELLRDVCTINMGQSPKSISYNDSGIGLPFFQGNADFGEKYPIARKWCSEPIKIAKPNDILISVRAPIGALNYVDENCCIGRGLAALTVNEKMVLPQFIYWVLKGKTEELNEMGTGSTFKAIGRTVLEEIKIPKMSINRQAQIIFALENVYKQISMRGRMLEYFDNLIKARFVEMFGDPVRNEKEWQTKALEDVCKSIVDCPHSTPSYTSEDTGFMCIRTSIVKKNRIMWEDIEYIPEEEYIQRIQRKKPEKGDVVYTREGAILGIAAVIDRDCNVALGQRSMLLSPDRAFCTPEFISVAMNFDSFLDNALKGMSGSASPHINVGDIKAFKMILPPIKQQEVFSDFVTQVDKSRFVVQKALDEAQLLFDSLMQEYFG